MQGNKKLPLPVLGGKTNRESLRKELTPSSLDIRKPDNDFSRGEAFILCDRSRVFGECNSPSNPVSLATARTDQNDLVTAVAAFERDVKTVFVLAFVADVKFFADLFRKHFFHESDTSSSIVKNRWIRKVLIRPQGLRPYTL